MLPTAFSGMQPDREGAREDDEEEEELGRERDRTREIGKRGRGRCVGQREEQIESRGEVKGERGRGENESGSRTCRKELLPLSPPFCVPPTGAAHRSDRRVKGSRAVRGVVV